MARQVIFRYKNYAPTYEIGSALAAFITVVFVILMISYLVTSAHNLYDIKLWLFILLIIAFCFVAGYMGGIIPWLYPRQPDILIESDGLSIKYRSTWHKLLWHEIHVSQSGMITYDLYGIPTKLTVDSLKLPMAYYIYDRKQSDAVSG